MFFGVVQAQPLENFIVRAYCENGRIHVVDIKPYIQSNLLYAPLADFKIFSENITVKHGHIAWALNGKNGIEYLDIPLEIVTESPVVNRRIADPD